MSRPNYRTRGARSERGAALLVMLALVGIITALAVVWVIDTGATEPQRVQNTARAMGMIRDALIARAASDANRPGSLPCPDVDNDGVSQGPGPEWTGSTCTSYIGRVPWKTLDLPDLRDADGQPFWYALSQPYRDSSGAGPLNSDTAGTLEVTGDAATTDVVAIIIAPGAPLATQNRVPADTAVTSELPQYLEGDNADADATYQASAESATFNDRVLPITRDMLMPSVEQRVARQARRCLLNLGAIMGGRYPFAADMADITSYADREQVSPGPPPIYSTTLYGRIPSNLNATYEAINGVAGNYAWRADDPQPGAGTTACFASTTWWNSWRELLLYRVAASYAPSAAAAGPCGSCLTVNSGSASANDVKFVVIVAGRRLRDALHPTETPSQTRALPFDKGNDVNYLEAAPNPNVAHITTFDGSGIFGKRPRAIVAGPLGGFNDRVECVSASEAEPCGAD